jgi:hypothetical protein
LKADNVQDDGDNTAPNTENIVLNEPWDDRPSVITTNSSATDTNLIRPAASETRSNLTKSSPNYYSSQRFVTIKKEGGFIRAFKMTWRLLICLSLTLFVAVLVLLLFIYYLMVDFYQLFTLLEPSF